MGSRRLLYFNLIKVLDRKNISNMELAKSINMSYATLSLKMTGLNDWKISEMLKIQQYIYDLTQTKYSLDYLFDKE